MSPLEAHPNPRIGKMWEMWKNSTSHRIQDHPEPLQEVSAGTGITGSSLDPSLEMGQLHPDGKSSASSFPEGGRHKTWMETAQEFSQPGCSQLPGGFNLCFPAWSKMWQIPALPSPIPTPAPSPEHIPDGKGSLGCSRSWELPTKPSPCLSSHLPHSALIFYFFPILFLILTPFPNISTLWDEGNEEPSPLWSTIPRDFQAGINKQKGWGPAR